VVLSGKAAPERLAELKIMGFANLGRVEPIRVDRILGLYGVVLAAGLVIFYLLRYPGQLAQISAEISDELQRSIVMRSSMMFWLTFSLVLAFATLFAAIVGSSRRHARLEHTPWGLYAFVGLLSVATFFLIHHGRNTFFAGLIRESREIRLAAHERKLAAERDAHLQGRQNQGEAGGSVVVPTGRSVSVAEANGQSATSQRRQLVERTPLQQLGRSAPWAVLPFLVAVSICRLARLRRWPSPFYRHGSAHALWERLLDGLTLMLVALAAFVLSRALREVAGIQAPPWIPQRGLLNWQWLSPILLLGFVIGVIVVRDVRLAAHAQIVDLDGQQPAPGKVPASTPQDAPKPNLPVVPLPAA
jgi:hypothetical protein